MPSDRTAGNAISRMPKSVRDQVSRALVDGADWKDVKRICADAGFPGVRAQNVTNYRKGEHQRWIAREERIEALRRDSEATADVVKFYVENGGSPAEAGLLSACEVMSKALVGLGPESLQILIAQDPTALFSITRELSRVAKLLTAKKAIEAAVPEEEAPSELSEDEQQAKVIEMVDIALGLEKAK